MRPIVSSVKVHHAVDAGEGGAATLVAMGIKLLLGEDITASLEIEKRQRVSMSSSRVPRRMLLVTNERRGQLTSQEKETILNDPAMWCAYYSSVCTSRDFPSDILRTQSRKVRKRRKDGD